MIRRYVIELGGREHELAVEALADGRYRVSRGDRSIEWSARRIGSTWSLQPAIGGHLTEVDIDAIGSGGDLSLTSGPWVGVPARVQDQLHRAAEKAASAKPAGPVELKSPMPGKVVRLLVAVGSNVTAGQPVVVVEAMKMENELKASRAGVVRELTAREGQAIDAGQTLVVFD
jgi:acetyl/propionyl-CoA carboxylase alpha subunit